MTSVRITIDREPAFTGGPRWIRVDGVAINAAEGVDRQRDEVINATARRAYDHGFFAAQSQIREALGL